MKDRPRRGRVADLLEIFEAPDEPPSATADDLISLTIGCRFRVRAVSIRGIDLAAADAARLEQRHCDGGRPGHAGGDRAEFGRPSTDIPPTERAAERAE